MRRVRAGERVVISFHGQAVAEIRPLEGEASSLDETLAELERDGRLSPARPGATALGIRQVAKRSEALARFLASRD